jgi:hypothetical protein
MKFIQGKARNQILLFATCMEDAIDRGNEVRIIDLFVNTLKLRDYGI